MQIGYYQVRFTGGIVPSSLIPKGHMKVIAPVLPGKHSPIRANGRDNPGIYLAEDTGSLWPR